MTARVLGPIGVDVERGPALLSAIDAGPSLAAHRSRHGEPGRPQLTPLLADLERVGLRGRGGAGFPFGRKLEATAEASGRPYVVVNLSEGEPASCKDAALALTAPHLVLDGAVVAARVLGSREVHLVVPGTDLQVRAAIETALRERPDERIGFVVHRADEAFVAGQATAVIELMAGRPNKPVTSWQPAAVRGHRGRPTLLSNGETFAQLAILVLHGVDAYLAHGTPEEPGTALLTIHDDLGRRVVEVPFGTKWEAVLAQDGVDRPVLLGGYHGTWADAGELRDLTVSRAGLGAVDLTLGAGVVLVPDGCPLTFATSITSYLAGESAGRCGPCRNGLPELARALERVTSGIAGLAETERLCGLVERRGACAHPDGTARMVRSVLTRFHGEVERHARGGCSYRRDRIGRSA
ncbi:NADH-ubiquinone oxidoreductase-F iron-sulfur binding region domain-containing protein [Nocardioides bizhenqiangii]|uniref:NADH-ubiquinone oxidoreductase-F iron-sulfur binding region domain-containing protein n=1 Tax=Nocardioides bizhenqiangii TaxID=3095076 RepID=A0ABZ0ZTG9_9ACTN|nr:NADH-ubiquinone oxidoreductase-F iron-sulfur binding region domain-containing protein [Nocardioides sp. HM61]WQQ27592.1 NADH-ubiquinone oxidoreductase-F iron-sulfur binding region domain-containing protein [Nocardioides sp. HM61]